MFWQAAGHIVVRLNNRAHYAGKIRLQAFEWGF
jgi:hypothetical protein